MTDIIKEIPYMDAGPGTREIYDRLMSLTGVGSPALIYRHFAVFPGFLEWVWKIIGPELENGHLVAEAPRLARKVPIVELPYLTRSDLEGFGIDDDAWSTVQAIISTYNRMNPVNLALITAIMSILRDCPPTAGTHQLPPPQKVPPATTQKLPPPVDLQSMDESLRSEILILSSSIPGPDETVVPTLYRHFAIWPDLMFAIAPGLLVAIESGALNVRMTEISEQIVPLADGVTARARERDIGPPPIESVLDMADTCERFMFVIPQLVAIGLAVEAALPDQ